MRRLRHLTHNLPPFPRPEPTLPTARPGEPAQRRVNDAIAEIEAGHVAARIVFRPSRLLARSGASHELPGYDGVVLGAALYMGHAHVDARRLVRRLRQKLSAVPVAVFAMGPQTSSDEDLAGSREQLDHDLAKVPELEPFSIAVFGGVVDPAKLHFPFSRMPASDARDWDAIDAWAYEIAGTFVRGSARLAAAPR